MAPLEVIAARELRVRGRWYSARCSDMSTCGGLERGRRVGDSGTSPRDLGRSIRTQPTTYGLVGVVVGDVVPGHWNVGKGCTELVGSFIECWMMPMNMVALLSAC
jgi:hypothetical protein